jgi:hypothetical protein
MATAVANAAAEAECPDGNDDDVGGFGSVWYAGSSAAAGRRRGSSGLQTTFAAVLASAIASTPRPAAFRPAPRRSVSPAATVNHSRLWFAAVDSPFMTVSSGLGGSEATRWEIARSRSLTGSSRTPCQRSQR